MKTFLQFTVSGVAAGSLYAIVALGAVFLYGGTRVVNFAHAGVHETGAAGVVEHDRLAELYLGDPDEAVTAP